MVFWWLSSPVASHLLCRLEIETDEQRDEYMIVHKRSLEEEQMEAAQQENAAAQGESTEEVQMQ